jgi:hypothetical protein
MGSVVKPFPCGLGATVAAAVLRGLVDQHRLRIEQIGRIVVYRPPESNDDLKHARGPFPDRSQAISSVPLALAAVLVDGQVTLERFESYNDPRVLRVAQLVEFADLAPQGILHQRVEVHTLEGNRYGAEGDFNLLDAPDPRSIARSYRSPVLDEARADELASIVSRIDTLDSISELADALSRGRS